MNDPVSGAEQDEDLDRRWMRMAIAQAVRGRGSVEPNPMVGCVIARGDQLLGWGHHESFGGPHAEVNALAHVAAGERLGDATAYVSLEPCCHHGKTPPCSETLITAGIGRVVIGTVDPFPRVDGGGIARLKDAGVDVTVGVCQSECQRILAPFAKRVATGLPWVTAKWAMTLDGKIATVAGESQWISGPASRRDVHQTRGCVDAIVVGMGTVRADDPTLTARPATEALRVAQRVVFCRRELPALSSRLVQTIDQAPLVLVVSPGLADGPSDAIEQAGATWVTAPSDNAIEMVRAAMDYFAAQSMSHVLVEGGGELLASFFDAGAVDACDIYLGGKVFGGQSAPGPVGGNGVAAITDAVGFELDQVERFDNDVKLSYRRAAPPSARKTSS